MPAAPFGLFNFLPCLRKPVAHAHKPLDHRRTRAVAVNPHAPTDPRIIAEHDGKRNGVGAEDKIDYFVRRDFIVIVIELLLITHRGISFSSLSALLDLPFSTTLSFFTSLQTDHLALLCEGAPKACAMAAL
jgi:hypothetical protein